MSANESDGDNSSSRTIGHLVIGTGPNPKDFGFCVRCIRD